MSKAKKQQTAAARAQLEQEIHLVRAPGAKVRLLAAAAAHCCWREERRRELLLGLAGPQQALRAFL